MISHLQDLTKTLNIYGISKEDVCLITSAALACRGIRDNNDIEIALKSDVRERILKNRGDELEYNPYSGVIKFTDKIECVFQLYRMFGIRDDELFKDDKSEIIQGYRVIRLELYISLKNLQNREKDWRDINLLKETPFWNRKIEMGIEQYLSDATKNGWHVPDVNIQEVWENIFSADKNVYVFGLGYIGKNIYNRILCDGFEKNLKGFLVSDREKNVSVYKGVPVLKPENIDDKERCIIIVAVAIQTMADNMEMLRRKGFRNLIEGFQFWS